MSGSVLSPGTLDAPSSRRKGISRIQWHDRSVTVPFPSVAILALELVDPDVWASGILELLLKPHPPAHAILIWADEAETWRNGRGR